MKLRRFWADNAFGWGIVWHVAIAVIIVILVALANNLLAPYAADIPDFLKTSSQDAQTLLLTLAGALLTVTIFLYSTTVLVLTTYSAQFTPRVIENFSNDHSISRIFGVFIGGTVYCILSLFFVNRNAGDIAFLTAGIGMVYILVCITHFVVFIITVSRSVQVQNLLSTLTRQAAETIDSFTDAHQDAIRIDTFSTDGYSSVLEVRSSGNGFFEENDFDEIHRLIKDEDCLIVLLPRIGDFISKNQLVAQVHHNGLDSEERLAKCLAEAFVLEEKRYINNDYRFTIQKIVEVALKAFSSSINDPNTGIYCIRHLGVLAGRLATIEGRYAKILLGQDEGHAKIIDQDFIFDRDLRDIFVQMVHYGKGDIYVVCAVLEALHTAWLVSTEGNKPAIESLVGYTFYEIEGVFTHPIEKKELSLRKQLFRLS